MFLVLGTALVFAALFLILSAVGGTSPERQGVSRSIAVLNAMTTAPTELTRELDKPFSERILEPLYARLQRIGNRITGADQVERIRQRLDKLLFHTIDCGAPAPQSLQCAAPSALTVRSKAAQTPSSPSQAATMRVTAGNRRRKRRAA